MASDLFSFPVALQNGPDQFVFPVDLLSQALRHIIQFLGGLRRRYTFPVRLGKAPLRVQRQDGVTVSQAHVQGHKRGPGLQQVAFPQAQVRLSLWKNAVRLFRLVDHLPGQRRHRLRQQAVNILSIRLWTAPAGCLDAWLELLTLLEG